MPPHRPTPRKGRRLKDVSRRTMNYKGQLPNRQVQFAIFRVNSYFRREMLNGGPLLPVSNVRQRCADAVGCGKGLVSRVKKIGESGKPFRTPGKTRKMKRKKRNVDDFTKCAIRNLIYEFHRKRHHFTLKSLLKKIKERGIAFEGGKETLRKVLLELGFKYKKRNGTRFLMEQPRIVVMRLNFLRRFKKAYDEGKKYRVYLDETWIFKCGSGLSFAWQDNDVRSCPVRSVSSGGRYIVIHAGGADGFVPGAGKVWPSNSQPQPGDDYHGDMDGRIMKHWFTKDLLPNLHKPSIIIMDNASYHSCQEESEKQPTSNSTKEAIKAWLKKEGIKFEPDMLRKELIALAKLNKKPKHYILEGILLGTKHEILRLPPYHACFNPIELVWGLVKRYFDAHVGRDQDYSTEMMVKIFIEALDSITPEVWRKICDKIERRILEAWELECNTDNEDFQMIINVDDGSDDEDEDSEWETFKKRVYVGHEVQCDVDDPEAVEEQANLKAVLNAKLSPKKKLSKVEQACGITFDEVLPDSGKIRSTLRKKRNAKRSLFRNEGSQGADISMKQQRKSTPTAKRPSSPMSAEVNNNGPTRNEEGNIKALITSKGSPKLKTRKVQQSCEMISDDALPASGKTSTPLRKRTHPKRSFINEESQPVRSDLPKQCTSIPIVRSVSSPINADLNENGLTRHEEIVEQHVLAGEYSCVQDAVLKQEISSESPSSLQYKDWWYVPCSLDFSLCWNMIQARLVSSAEIQSAVLSIQDFCGAKDDVLESSTLLNATALTYSQEKDHSLSSMIDGSVEGVAAPDLGFSPSELLPIRGASPNSSTHKCTSFSPPQMFDNCNRSMMHVFEGGEEYLPHNIQFSESDLSSLMSNSFPSEKIVDSYLKLISAHYTCLGLRIFAFTTKYYRNVMVLGERQAVTASDLDIFEFDILFVPIHVGALWCLCVVKPQEKILICLNVLGLDNEECFELVFQYITTEYQRIKGEPMSWMGWSKEDTHGVSENHDLHDSAVIVCCYARRVCEGLSCTFGIETLPSVRQQMITELRCKKLSKLDLPLPVVSIKLKVKNAGELLHCPGADPIPFQDVLSVFGLDEDISNDVMIVHSDETQPHSTKEDSAGGVHDCPKLSIARGTAPVVDKQEEDCVMISDSDENDEEISLQQQGLLDSKAAQEILEMPPHCLVLSQYNYKIRVSDLQTLLPNAWLNDEVINLYFKMLCSSTKLSVLHLDSNFYPELLKHGYEKMSKWTKKVDIFQYAFIFLPIHLGNHWALIVVDKNMETVTYYDSLPSPTVACANRVLNFLKEEHLHKRKAPLGNRWIAGNAQGVPKQIGSDDCGIFMCMFAKTILQRIDYWPFTSDYINELRKNMINEILKGQISAFDCVPLQPNTLRLPSNLPLLPLPRKVEHIKHAELLQSGFLHQNRSYFPSDRRNAQCTAISACALIAYAYLERPFSAAECDSIVLAGDELYIQCRTGAIATDQNWLAVDDLPKDIEAFGVKTTMHITYVGGGSYKKKDRHYELADALKVAMGTLIDAQLPFAHYGFLYIGRSKTISFWPTSKGSFLMFNSHCVSRYNFVETDEKKGASRLFKCFDEVSLSKLIMANDDYDNSVWILAKVKISILR